MGLMRVLLLASADPNEMNGKGVSLLHRVAYDGHLDGIKLLIDATADPNALDQHGQTPLFFAPNKAVCAALVNVGADVNAVNLKGQSALHLAGRAGLSEVLACICPLTAKKVPELRDVHGATAGYYARHAGIPQDWLIRHKLMRFTSPASGARSVLTSPCTQMLKPAPASLQQKSALASYSPLSPLPAPARSQERASQLDVDEESNAAEELEATKTRKSVDVAAKSKERASKLEVEGSKAAEESEATKKRKSIAAAVKIQALARGSFARARVRQERERPFKARWRSRIGSATAEERKSEEEKRAEAATKIQAVARGSFVRKSIKQDPSAKRAVWKGFKNRQLEEKQDGGAKADATASPRGQTAVSSEKTTRSWKGFGKSSASSETVDPTESAAAETLVEAAGEAESDKPVVSPKWKGIKKSPSEAAQTPVTAAPGNPADVPAAVAAPAADGSPATAASEAVEVEAPAEVAPDDPAGNAPPQDATQPQDSQDGQVGVPVAAEVPAADDSGPTASSVEAMEVAEAPAEATPADPTVGIPASADTQPQDTQESQASQAADATAAAAAPAADDTGPTAATSEPVEAAAAPAEVAPGDPASDDPTSDETQQQEAQDSQAADEAEAAAEPTADDGEPIAAPS